MKDKQYYIDQFQNTLNRRCYPVDSKWYNGTFEWRIIFDFRTHKHNRFVLDAGWSKIINFCVNNKIKYRHRKEGEQVIFTSDPVFLDFVIIEGLYKQICYLEYTSDKYEAALSSVDMVSTGVKLVKKDTKFCYQITLGHMGWYKNSEIKIALTKYLVDNNELFEARGYQNEILKRFKTQNRGLHINSTVYDGFVFYAADPDDILTLHLLAPGKIRKVIKLVKGTAT